MDGTEKIREEAGPNSLLAELSEQQLQAMLSVSRRAKYRKGEVIYNQGDRGESAALILTGAVKISTFSVTGREIVFAYLSAGDMVGDVAVLDGAVRTATATAAEKVECFILPRVELNRMIASDPDLTAAVIRFLCGRLRATNLLLESDRSYEQAARLARGILRLLKEHGHRDSAAGTLGLSISQSDLGAFVSMARENVSRQVSDWSRAGILKLERGRIVILDKEALEEIADIFED
ncbi:MAG: Crp/Fnr family transcriptional regulator [Hyphomonadaceae bacterium]|nr:Crp/Fnr family transcriptional regulator [Hyphomonadaceae bacterium]